MLATHDLAHQCEFVPVDPRRRCVRKATLTAFFFDGGCALLCPIHMEDLADATIYYIPIEEEEQRP
jgi:hypothetical protein